MNWIFLALVTAVFYGAYNVFIKISSGHINQIVGAVILQIVAALLGGGNSYYFEDDGRKFLSYFSKRSLVCISGRYFCWVS